jgi:hypothetical protein
VSSLPEQLDPGEYPPAIILKEPGARAEGTLVEYSAAPTRFSNGKDVPIAVIEDKDGNRGSLWLNTTVLLSQFAKIRPKPGERMVITYRGLKDDADPPYHDWRVTCPDRPPYVPDWDALAGEFVEDEPA